MTKELFTAILMSGTISAVASTLIKHYIDSYYLKQISKIHDEHVAFLKKAHAEEVKALKNEINRCQDIIAENMVKQAVANAKAPAQAFRESVEALSRSFRDINSTFYEVEPLPKAPDGWVDVDFPNSDDKEGES